MSARALAKPWRACRACPAVMGRVCALQGATIASEPLHRSILALVVPDPAPVVILNSRVGRARLSEVVLAWACEAIMGCRGPCLLTDERLN